MCNHPELFERRDAKSPIFFQPCVYNIPRLVYDYDVRFEKLLVLQKHYIITSVERVAQRINDCFRETIFNFCYSLNLSYQDIYKIFNGNIGHRWSVGFTIERQNCLNYLQEFWGRTFAPKLKFDYNFKASPYSINNSEVLRNLVFTKSCRDNRVIYTHSTHYYHSMPETVEHRKIRFKNLEENEEDMVWSYFSISI